MKFSLLAVTTASLCSFGSIDGFQTQRTLSQKRLSTSSAVLEAVATKSEASDAKKRLLDLLGTNGYVESVLADPDTKEPLRVVSSGVLMGGGAGQGTKVLLQSTSGTYQGTSDTFLNLLEPVQSADSGDKNGASQEESSFIKQATKRLVPFIPPPLRSPLATAGLLDEEYIPMRDLFTSPAVSFAYERGWRQGFAQAGFPGPDKEADLAMEYFAEPIANAGVDSSVLVDMSCATGKCKIECVFLYLRFETTA